MLRIKKALKQKYYYYKFLYQFRAKKNRNAIFCFHGFHNSFFGKNYLYQTSRNELINTINAVRKKFIIVSLSEIVKDLKTNKMEINFPKAAFTIDDGFSSILKVIDIFRLYSIKPTFFICPTLIEKETVPFPEIVRIASLLTSEKKIDFPKNKGNCIIMRQRDRLILAVKWIEYFKTIEAESLESELSKFLRKLKVSFDKIINHELYDPLLNWEQLKSLRASIEIGSHTCNHYHLPSLSDRQLKVEIFESKNKIEKMLSINCISFCYPYGDKLSFGEREMNVVKQSDYKFAVSLIPGFVNTPESVYSIPRFNGLSQLIF